MSGPTRGSGAPTGSAPAGPTVVTRLAPSLLVGAYLLLMVFLVLLSLDARAQLTNVNLVLPVLVSGLLGLVTNPQTPTRPWLWVLMAGAALVAGVVAGVEMLLYPAHSGAMPALIAAAAALGALFVDTTSNTHPTSRS
ncbi:hypothetical protein [Kitasatospora acidiphila]|uniref:hypothetical protein n=1 Tax=Kitasatospora acidiphila TaxID=2567942 RepID=UPI003C77B951